MCIIIAAPAGVQVKEDLLQTQFAMNPDGWGIMTVAKESSRLAIIKGLELKHLLRAHNRLNINKPRIYHLRYATHGSVVTANCHPFVVRSEPMVAMAHNGIVSKFAKNPRVSDSLLFAKDYLRPILLQEPALFGTEELADLIAKVDSSSRFALMKEGGEIQLVGNFSEHEGLMVSNELGLHGYYGRSYSTKSYLPPISRKKDSWFTPYQKSQKKALEELLDCTSISEIEDWMTSNTTTAAQLIAEFMNLPGAETEKLDEWAADEKDASEPGCETKTCVSLGEAFLHPKYVPVPADDAGDLSWEAITSTLLSMDSGQFTVVFDSNFESRQSFLTTLFRAAEQAGVIVSATYDWNAQPKACRVVKIKNKEKSADA